ncbi:MAG TPA: hypothetical protein VKA38_04705 [Draconibacterium sp.]|nr:hypothetical protein [Draconibacterium sp.]
MKNGGGIKYIRHSEIDFEKWDHCIESALNGRVYAYHWHLDRTAVVWDALIYGDYEFVMPLPVKRKWGLKYVYQPLYCQQLGIFPAPTMEIAGMFYSKMIKNLRYVDIQINSKNVSLPLRGKAEFIRRNNYLLNLDRKYQNILSGYSKNTKRNIARAKSNHLGYIAGLRLEEYLDFKMTNNSLDIEKKEINKLKSIIAFGLFKGFGEICGVYTAENKLCAAVYFYRWKNRVIYLNAVSDWEGKNLRAMFFLIDKYIESKAGQHLVLDFEGSMIPGLARFYSGFGATPETYYRFTYNRLSPLVNWLKRNIG